MSFATKYSTGRKFDIDTADFGYRSLENVYAEFGEGHIYPLRAIFINTKGKYGESVVFATDDFFVNVPAHMVELCKQILSDDEAIADINRHAVGFTVHTYLQKKYNRECYGVNFVDM